MSTSDIPRTQSSLQMFVKRVSLVLLVFQNVTSILLLRYVRTTPGPRFLMSTLVFNSEIQKTIITIIYLIFEERSIIGAMKTIYEKIIRNRMDTLKMTVPAFLYTAQNLLLLTAISNLDAATFQVTAQLKILTTALCTVLMLPRQLNLVQWLALFLLFLGVSLVQVENMTSTTPKQDVNAVVGLLSVIGACTLSGLGGVYFEKILKTSDVSIWIRNVQLGFFGMIFSYAAMYMSEGEEVRAKGILFGYTNAVWLAVVVQSAGGILVAIVIKYADNIMKGFATSLAIIFACIVSIILFDFQLTLLFTIGAMLVICSIFIYSKPDLILHVPIFNLIFREKSILL